jgi:hypothetical protein
MYGALKLTYTHVLSKQSVPQTKEPFQVGGLFKHVINTTPGMRHL